MSNVSRHSVLMVIREQTYCDESCPYTEFCPRMLDSMFSRSKECLIRLNYSTEFDRFYNLYFAENDGIRNEMRSAAYALAKQSDTSDDLLTYFNSLAKMSSTFYAPDKSNKEQQIPEVNIIFRGLEPPNTPDEEEDKNDVVKGGETPL